MLVRNVSNTKKDGFMKSTIKDIAKAANVSVGTVSMALNNRQGVNKHTRKQILEVAEQLCYVPNYSARSLVTNDSKFIGLMIPEIVNPFYSAIVDSMTTLAEERGYTMLLGISNNKTQQEKNYVETFASRNALGVIIVPMLRNYTNTDYLNILKIAKIPMVFCTESYPDWSYGKKDNIPCVMTDFKQGEYEMVRYLLSRGHKKICFVNVDLDVQFTKLRLEGYYQAFEEAGIPVDPENLFFLQGVRFKNAYAAADEILARKPDAIACINDLMTIGIMKRMYERQIRIPEDIALGGFDDIMFAELAQKPVTTVRQSLQQICKKTMEILEHQIQNGIPKAPTQSPKPCLIQPKLIIRETTN